MFGRIGRIPVNRPWLTILAWIIAAVALVALAPELKATNDQADFLPSHYESVQAGRIAKDAFPQRDQPSATAVFKRTDGGPLTDADRTAIDQLATALQDKHYKGIGKVAADPAAVSPDGRLALADIVAADGDPYADPVLQAVRDLRADARPLLAGTAVTMGVTGPAATAVDAADSSDNTDGMIMMATLVLIIVLLAVIFRSPLIALLPVVMIVLMLVVANGLISVASAAGGLRADPGNSALLIVVMFGVGTDYILFLLFRYRELLRTGQPPKQALSAAVTRVGETVASAAGAVIVAFLALLFSTMGSLKALGPSLAIAVAVTLVASLTLVPAVFSLLGSKAFWPSKAWQRQPRNVLAGRIGALTSGRPLVTAIVSAGVLAVLAVGAFAFKPEFDSETSLPKNLESVQAMQDLQQGFSAGQSDPSLVLLRSTGGARLDQAALDQYKARLEGVPGVSAVSPAVLSPQGDVAQFSAALAHRPASEEAIALVSGQLRETAHRAAPAGTAAVVGGTTAVLADIETAVEHDYTVVFPLAGLAIMLILGLLLRSVVAPVYLMLSVGLGFAATLGATVWLFQGAKGEKGLLFMLPVVVYLFVVALGTDYNILMVARLREEVRRGVRIREAVGLAVASSAPTVGAAAVILAGTFGVLLLAKNSLLQQMGFAVAFGILLNAFVMAMLLVPSLTALLGRKAWWPGRQDGPAPVTERPDQPVPAGVGSTEEAGR